MAWISVHEQLRDHHKLRELSKQLSCSRHEAIGILVSLWLWGINNADQYGRLSSADAQDIADGVMYRAQCAAHLVNILVNTGWLQESANGQYSIHDWDVWQSQWYKALEKRESNTKRMREIRAQKSDDTANGATNGAMHSSEHVQASPSPSPYTLPEEDTQANALCPTSRTNETSSTVLSVQETSRNDRNDIVQEVVSFLNRTCGTNYRSSGDKTREKIIARLNEGFTLDDFKTVILKKHMDWHKDPERCKYLRPETLFGTKFEGYLNQPDATSKNSFLDIALREAEL